MKLPSFLLAVVAIAGCTETRDPLYGTQSISVELVSPTSPGDVDNRLAACPCNITVNLRARDADGNLDSTFTGALRVYAQFLGTLTPSLEDMPIKTINMTNGVAMNESFTLPSGFGPTTLWFDNGSGLGPDYTFGAVTGNSPTLWYRDPFVQDLQKPRDEMALDALSTTPLQDKQIRVADTRHPNGVLVVTSTFAQGYTVADVNCATGGASPTGPCAAGDYDHAMIFTFSAPRDQYGRPIVQGQLIHAFNGGLSEFNGLTEVGFPRTFIADPARDLMKCPESTPFFCTRTAGAMCVAEARDCPSCAGYPDCNQALVPPPVSFSTTWFQPLSNPAGRINFEKNEAGPIKIDGPTVCALDDGPGGVYTKFKQWTIDPSPAGNMCSSSNVINIITAGTDFTTDPHTLVGRKLGSVTGIVRPVNIGSFNVWIVYPRGKDDMVLQ